MSKMSKNLKRLLVAVAIFLVGMVLVVSGTIEVNIFNLIDWVKNLGQGVFEKLAPIIPVKEILLFGAGFVVAMILNAIRNRKN